MSFRVSCATLSPRISGSPCTMIHWLRGTLGWLSLDGLWGDCLIGRLGVTSDQWAWSSADSGWLGVGGLFGRAGVRFSKVKNFLYWAIKRSNFQEAIQNTNLHTFTNKSIHVTFITSSVRIAWQKFIHVQAEVTLTAVQIINIESLFFLRKFIGPKNPLLSARIAYFVFLHRSAKNMAVKFKGRVKNANEQILAIWPASHSHAEIP